MESLNGITAPDGYTSGASIDGPRIRRVILDVANQAIYWQLKLPTSGAGGNWDSTETLMLPGSRKLPGSEGCLGVRIRAATPLAQLPAGSSQAVVTVMAVT